MAKVTRVDPEEALCRENRVREHQRPINLRDSFTWKYRYRAADLAVFLTAGGAHLHNLWNRKPWHFALYGRLAGVMSAAFIAYALHVISTLKGYF